jgi:hypothetical protein
MRGGFSSGTFRGMPHILKAVLCSFVQGLTPSQAGLASATPMIYIERSGCSQQQQESRHGLWCYVVAAGGSGGKCNRAAAQVAGLSSVGGCANQISRPVEPLVGD